ncbi:MAG TPA: hypothetical protein VIL42_00725 [Sphingomicrobium sp.]|jgi:hypothetical protein
MARKLALGLLAFATTALGGCALQAAMLASDLIQNMPVQEGPSNSHLRPKAVQACTAQAAQHGSVFIVDVEQRRADRIIVWGSVTDAQQHRRSFECHFTTKLAGFKLGDVVTSN